MSQVYIVSGCRTPIGAMQGQFEKYTATELGTIAISEAIKRADLKPEDVDHCIMGQVLTAGQGQNTARQAAVNAKIPLSSPAYTINLLCGSGVKSVALGMQGIKSGDYNIVVAGGQECMTRAQHSTYLRGQRLGALNLCDTLLHDGLTDAFNNMHMGDTAEEVAKIYKISREAQDAFAFESLTRAKEAISQGHFDAEIVGVPDKKTNTLITKDEFAKCTFTPEKVRELKPAFQANGTVTAANASSISDAAAAVLLASEEQVKQRGLKPMARIVAYAESGCGPEVMGMGPVESVQNVLKKAGWTKDDVDLYELNEAFSSSSIACNQQLQIDPKKVNIGGGSVAIGHPIGCSGTRCLVTLLYHMKRLNKKKGIVSLCVGGGMGVAMAVELV